MIDVDSVAAGSVPEGTVTAVMVVSPPERSPTVGRIRERGPSSAQLAEPREIRPRHRKPVDWDDRLDVESEALYVAQ